MHLLVEPLKIELILLTNKHKFDAKLKLLWQPTSIKPQYQILGYHPRFHIKLRFSFGKHLKKKTATFWQVKRAVGITWGFNSSVIHWIYIKLIRPRTQYVSIG